MSVLVRSCKMENISIIENSLGEQFVVIDHGNEQFTSMPKAVYEAQQVALSTPIVSSDAD